MRDIVSPIRPFGSQRSNGPKAARRFAVALGSPLEGVGRLVRDHQARPAPTSYPARFPVRSQCLYLAGC